MVELITFFLGAGVGWGITHWYYLKASADQKREIDRLKEELRPRTTLQDFERYLTDSTWSSTYIDQIKAWVCAADNTFQIRVGDCSREFNERWTTVYPDSLSGAACPVYLLIGGLTIKELTFISMDGGRIFVPMTERRPTEDDNVEFFWNLGSLEVKVCRVIGSYYIYGNLEGVATRSRVALIPQ